MIKIRSTVHLLSSMCKMIHAHTIIVGIQSLCNSVGPVEVPFSSILFEELLHKGTFKVVHHGVVNYPEQSIMSQPVAVKRLRGIANYV